MPSNGDKWVSWRDLGTKLDSVDARIRRVEIGVAVLAVAVAIPKVGGPTIPEAVHALASLLT